MDAEEFNKLLKLINKDTKAFEKIYNFYYKRAVFHLNVNYRLDIAEDVAQDFFCKLFLIAENQEFIKYPTQWILKCCENILLRKLEHINRVGEYSEDALGHNNTTYIKLDFFEDLLKPLDDEIDKQILRMRYLQGYSLFEICDLINLTYSATRQRVSRAVKKLEKALKGQGY